MNLYILRHGLAVERGTPGYRRDQDRPLTPEGRQRLGLITQAMAVLKVTPDAILSSPFLRARQTAEIVAVALALRPKLTFTDHLTPGGDHRALIGQIDELSPRPDNVMLVGHEPDLGQLIACLLAGGTDMRIELKKGGLCRLEVEIRRHPKRLQDGAKLKWLLTPKQMAAMV